MKSGTKIAIFVFFMLVWAPWITDDFAVGKVVEKFGSPEAQFNHFGQDMAVKDVPTEVRWLPFVVVVAHHETHTHTKYQEPRAMNNASILVACVCSPGYADSLLLL